MLSFNLNDPLVIMAIAFLGVLAVIVFIFIRVNSAKTRELIEVKKEVLEYKDALEKEQEKNQKKISHTPMQTSLISEQLRKIEALESEIQRQKERVADAKAIAQEAVRVKYDFLTNIRHEIRTPLNSILSFSELLMQNIKSMQLQSYAKNIHVSGEKLLQLMDKIIELSKLEAGTYNIEETAVDFRFLFQSIVQEHQSSALAKGLKLELEIDPHVPELLMIDAKKVKSIVDNLISNAIKFTQTGYVQVYVRQSGENLLKNSVDLEIEVQDSGIGIAPKEQEKLFDTFEKVLDIDGMETFSAGLGLSIDKKKAKLMKGDVVLRRSVPKEGSVFVLKLFDVETVIPTAQEDTTTDAHIDFSLIRPDGAKVMLMYNDEASREVIVESFLATHVEIESFSQPREALEALRQHTYDMIIVDVEILLDDDGAVAKMISKLSDAPVVTLTHISPKNIPLEKSSLHIVGHIRKPISKQHLFKLSLKVLNSPELLHGATGEVAEDMFGDISHEARKEFLMLHAQKLQELYQTAKTTKDLTHIRHFAKELYKAATMTKIEYFKNFAKELFKNIELFDIESINQDLNRYGSDLQKLKSSKI